MTFPRRGEIYLVEFDPARGGEIQKTRPALVIQNDVGNRHSPVTIVAAITSKLSPVPFPVDVVVSPTKANGLSLRSSINLGQIRSVDRSRLRKRVGTLDAAVMVRVDTPSKSVSGWSHLDGSVIPTDCSLASSRRTSTQGCAAVPSPLICMIAATLRDGQLVPEVGLVLRSLQAVL